MCTEPSEFHDRPGSRTEEIREKIRSEMLHFLDAYAEELNIPPCWKPPLIGFADVRHPYIRRLRELISPTHFMPEDILPEASIVLVYFIPFREEIGRNNVSGERPSQEWADVYGYTNEMFLHMNDFLKETLESWGYRAQSPDTLGPIGTLSAEKIYSNWSQRHIAYAAGLGTFGVNNMLITENGCVSRLFSLVTDLDVAPGAPLTHENCLYRQSGKCLVCVRRCPISALSPDEPFKRELCRNRLTENEAATGERVCGKCTVGVPCSFRAF